MKSQAKTILIADDHPIFRQGLKHILEKLEGLSVIAEAESGDSALTQIKFLNPDIAILDIAMPGKDGLQVLDESRTIHPNLMVIIITSYDDPAYLERAMELGAKAYLLKDSAGDNLADCLTAVLAGDVYITPSLGAREPRLPELNLLDTTQLGLLTQTERAVLDGISRFCTSKEIAREMDISYRTVQNHRANITAKLDLKGWHQLTRFARANREALERV